MWKWGQVVVQIEFLFDPKLWIPCTVHADCFRSIQQESKVELFSPLTVSFPSTLTCASLFCESTVVPHLLFVLIMQHCLHDGFGETRQIYSKNKITVDERQGQLWIPIQHILPFHQLWFVAAWWLTHLPAKEWEGIQRQELQPLHNGLNEMLRPFLPLLMKCTASATALHCSVANVCLYVAQIHSQCKTAAVTRQRLANFY